METTTAPEPTPKKKPYTPPVVTEHGTLRDLTRAGGEAGEDALGGSGVGGGGGGGGIDTV